MTLRAMTLRDRLASPIILLILAGFGVMSLATLQLLKLQPAGVDFAGLWGGGKAALTDIARLYDFRFVSELQGWPLGRYILRPYAYPPSALLLLTPIALIPWKIAYLIWTAVTGAFFWWAGWRAGAPKWFVLIPWVAFAAFCGQATFLLGGLVMIGLTLRSRPILAGVLLGAAAALKPQLLVLLPLALAAEGRWRTFISTGVTGLALCAVSAEIWGLGPWVQWFAALGRFQYLISHASALVANAITPYAALVHWGLPGAAAFVLAPGAALWVWLTFRRGADFADRLIALFGGAFLISPYAMNYELALFAPACAIYMTRAADRRWPGFLAACVGHALVVHPAFLNLAAILSLPLQKAIPLGRQPEAGFAEA